MSVLFVNKYSVNYGADFSDNFNIASVQANAGETILFTVQYSDAGGATKLLEYGEISIT